MRFLLIKLRHIGDTLLMTPGIRLLRECYPDCRIDVVVRRSCETILAGNPDIDQVHVVARPERKSRTWRDRVEDIGLLWHLLRGQRYDYAFDLSHSDRAKWLIVAAGARYRCINDWHYAIGGWSRFFNRVSHFDWGQSHQVLKDFVTIRDCVGLTGDPGPLVMAVDTDVAALTTRLQGFDPARPYVVVHPSSRWAFKEWDPVRWVEFIDWLGARDLQVILTGGNDARERSVTAQLATASATRVIDAAGQLNLTEVAGLLRHAAMYAGIDTAVMHMAAATQTPCLVLFGPSQEWSWGPWHCRHELVLGPCTCKAARKFTCDKSKIYPCMAAISLAEVQAAAVRLLDQASSPAPTT